MEFLAKTMAPPRLDGADTVVCWLSRKILPLQHRPLKMCEYQPNGADNATLDEDVLLLLLRALIVPSKVKAVEGVPMFTFDNPAPAVRCLLFSFAHTPTSSY